MQPDAGEVRSFRFTQFMFDRFDVCILKNLLGNVVDSICLATGYRSFIQFQPHSPLIF